MKNMLFGTGGERLGRWHICLAVAFCLCLAMVMMAGCATMGGKIVDPVTALKEMTPVQRVDFLSGLLESQYETYLAEQTTVIPLAKKPIIQVRYEFITELKPVLATYKIYVQTGVVPPEAIEVHLLHIFERLSNALGG